MQNGFFFQTYQFCFLLPACKYTSFTETRYIYTPMKNVRNKKHEWRQRLQRSRRRRRRQKKSFVKWHTTFYQYKNRKAFVFFFSVVIFVSMCKCNFDSNLYWSVCVLFFLFSFFPGWFLLNAIILFRYV